MVLTFDLSPLSESAIEKKKGKINKTKQQKVLSLQLKLRCFCIKKPHVSFLFVPTTKCKDKLQANKPEK